MPCRTPQGLLERPSLPDLQWCALLVSTLLNVCLLVGTVNDLDQPHGRIILRLPHQAYRHSRCAAQCYYIVLRSDGCEPAASMSCI